MASFKRPDQPSVLRGQLFMAETKKISISEAKIALCGASIINGLERYPDIWNNFFAPLSAINLGIGGDKVQHILWRMEDMVLPPTVEYLFIHCGTNNLECSSPKDIADGILAIGIMAKTKYPDVKVIVGGLLHCNQDVQSRFSVAEVNKVLRQKIHKLKEDLYYMEEDCDWINDDDSLNMDFLLPRLHTP